MRRAAFSRDEAQRRLEQYGPNQLKSAPETPWWRRLLEQFQNFLVIILLVATVISVVEWLLQDPRESALPYEAIVILAIVILNALLGFFQEVARRALGARADGAWPRPKSTVIRDGERQRIAADEIVPGDIVLVEAGDKIPADARVIESANLHTDEAPLTGESLPVAKDARRSTRDVGLGDRRNMLYLQHGRHLWPRPRRGGRDRHGDRGRPHRRPARSRREGADAAAAGARPHRQAPERHHARHLRGRVRDRPAQQPR